MTDDPRDEPIYAVPEGEHGEIEIGRRNRPGYPRRIHPLKNFSALMDLADAVALRDALNEVLPPDEFDELDKARKQIDALKKAAGERVAERDS